MYHAVSSIVLAALLTLTTFAAPSWHRDIGWISQHRRRHFQPRSLKHGPLQHSGKLPKPKQYFSPNNSQSEETQSLLLSLPPVDERKPTAHRPTNPSCSTLIDIYDTMGGQGWTNQTGWSRAASLRASADNCCDWFGVTCSADGLRILGIELPNNGLRGPISDAIQLLPDLQTLNLSSNFLRTTIPSLTNSFHVLDLSHALLYGDLPAALFHPNLTSLHLSHNIFDGTLDLRAALRLEEVFLDDNYFTGLLLGPSLGKKWKKIVIRNNRIAEPLPDLTGAGDLEEVLFGNNKFTGTMFDPTPLKKLVYFDLRSNLLTGVLPALESFNIPSLKLLGLAGNAFTGPIPHSLAIAPPSLETCSVVHETPRMELPCDEISASNITSTWAAKCGIIRACQTGIYKRA